MSEHSCENSAVDRCPNLAMSRPLTGLGDIWLCKEHFDALLALVNGFSHEQIAAYWENERRLVSEEATS